MPHPLVVLVLPEEVSNKEVPPVVETVHPLPCSLEISASTLLNRALNTISPLAVPSRPSELLWETMEELRASLMSSSKPLMLLRKLSS